jgi:CHAT domain-containing protein
MFEAVDRDRALSRAGALRESMLAMIERSSQPMYSHPMFWAPFVLVGNSAR